MIAIPYFSPIFLRVLVIPALVVTIGVVRLVSYVSKYRNVGRTARPDLNAVPTDADGNLPPIYKQFIIRGNNHAQQNLYVEACAIYEEGLLRPDISEVEKVRLRRSLQYP